MKRYLALALLVLAGCATSSGPNPAVVRFVVQSIALASTTETIKHQPATKPKFVLTVRYLDALIEAGSSDPVRLQNALTNLYDFDLRSPSGQIVFAEGAMLINFVGREAALQIDTRTNANRYIKPVTLGLRDGIAQAVALSP